jgi:hypothetical protein
VEQSVSGKAAKQAVSDRGRFQVIGVHYGDREKKNRKIEIREDKPVMSLQSKARLRT